MKKITTGWLALLLVFVSAGLLRAHHGLNNFDTTKAVRVKGTIVQFHEMNPHSFIFLDEREAGQLRRWAIEGPSVLELKQIGFATDLLKSGDLVEVCGYMPKEATIWQIANAGTNSESISGRLINGEMLVMPDGKQQIWSDYGAHKCFAPGYTDQHSSR